MTFTSPTDDILCNDDGFMYGFEASGAIKAGQVVTVTTSASPTQPFVVQAYPIAAATENSVGVAIYTAADGEDVAVAGNGCIVRCIVSGTSKCVAGDDLYAGWEGKVDNSGTYGSTSPPIGVALETQATADGTVRVLLSM